LKKLIGILILLAAVVAAFLWFYKSVETPGRDVADALRAVPDDAALILETGNAAEIWRDLSQSGVIWEELQATDLYFRLNVIGLALDSAMRSRAELRKYLDRKPLAVSVHSSGARTYSFLLSIPLSGNADEDRLKDEVRALLKPNGTPEIRTYEGVSLITVQPSFTDSPITFFASDGLLVVSLNSILAEESVRALKQAARVTADPSFVRARKTADSNARARLFINHTRFAGLVKPYAGKDAKGAAFFTTTFGNWSALDLTMRSNAFLLNGFVHAPDSSEAWLSGFSDSKAPKIKLLASLPVNTAYFAFYGFGDYAEYYKRRSLMRESAGVKYKVDKALKSADGDCNCKSEALLTGWIGSQAAVFITEPSSSDYASHRFAAFHVKSRTAADEALEKLEAAFAGGDEPLSESDAEFDGHLIRKLNIGRLYGTLVGDAFGGLDSPYAVRIGETVLMGNSLNAVRVLIQSVASGKTLSEDAGFRDFNEQISSEAHFAVYSALSRSPFIYEALLDEEHAKPLAGQRETLRKFQGFVYQVRHYKDGLYYNNIFFKHNPVYEQETTAIWEARLKAPVRGKPHLVKNHYTGALEAVVQDIENRIYLLANTGKVLWEATLDGPIEGDIVQVDLYKNRKLQMFFSTRTKLYVLDRNGNNVEGFPVTLPEKASAPASVNDYDNSRDYRFFVPLESGKTMAVDARGKKVEGWSFTDSEARLITPVEHIRVRSKDYLFAVNAKGRIHLLDRQGNSRHKVHARMPEGALQPFAASHPEQVIGSGGVYAADSLGTAYRIGFDGRTEKLDFGLRQSPRYVRFHDLNRDGTVDCIIQTESGITAFSMEGRKLFEFEAADLKAGFEIHDTGGSGAAISAYSETAKKVYLFDAEGRLFDGFPLIGDFPSAVGDLNGDGNLNLLTGLSEGQVFGYAVSSAR